MPRNSHKSNKEFKENLDPFGHKYLSPDEARSLDQKVISILVEKLMPLIKGPQVLEMGYGDGLWTGRLIETFGNSHLVDASLELINHAKRMHGNKLVTYHSYFEEFTPLCLFDSVICTYVLEHVVDPVSVLQRCRAWLKLDGLLLVAVPNATSLHRRLGVVMGLQKDLYTLSAGDRGVGHRRVYDASTLESDLTSAGFAIGGRIPCMFKPLPNSLLSCLSTEQIQGLWHLGDLIPEDQRAILVYSCRPV